MLPALMLLRPFSSKYRSLFRQQQVVAPLKNPDVLIASAAAAAAAAVSIFLYSARVEKVMYLSFMHRHSSIMK